MAHVGPALKGDGEALIALFRWQGPILGRSSMTLVKS